nr:hypothetical protein [Tanacetum cinerariifolium]
MSNPHQELTSPEENGFKKVVVTEDGIRHDLHLNDADGVECLPNEEIFTELAFIINAQVDDLSSHTNQYTSFALIQKAFANMRRVEKEEEVEVPAAPTPPSPSNKPSPPPQEPITTPLQDKIAQAFEIMKLKKRVKKLEKKRRSKSSGLKRLRKGRKDNDNIVIKDASATEPTMFDDEEVTIIMVQTLIKMKAEKARLFDEQMAKRLHDEEVKQAAAREKQEKDDLEKDKRKQISIAQARKNMFVYLKNMVGYKMEHFRGMNYDKVRPIFKREYNKVQTLFKPDKDIKEPHKKIVVKETLLQESFKKLKAVEVLDLYEGQSTKEKKFGYILQVIKLIELKKLDGLLGEEGLGDQEDASKQSIADIDQDEGTTLVDDTQGRINKEDLFGVHDLSGDEVFVDVPAVTAAKKEFSIVDPVTTPSEVFTSAEDVEVAIAVTITQISKDELTLAQILMEIKAAKPKAKGVTIQEPKPEKPLKIKDQIALDEEVARKLEAERKAEMEEEERIAKEKVEANIAMIVE